MAKTITINQGDTLGAIAQANNTDVATLAKANNIADPNRIMAGASLTIPDAVTAAPQPAAVPGITTSDAIRNQEQQARDDQAKKDQEASAELARLRTQKEIADVKTQLNPNPAPVAPNLEAKYTALRSEPGSAGISVNDLESHLNKLKGDQTTLENDLLAFKEGLHGKGSSQGALDNAISEKEAFFNDRKARLQQDLQTTADQLQTRYSVINSIMNFAQTDYQNATNQYNTAYNQALSMLNYVKGAQSLEYTQQERAKDDARANIQVLTNLMQQNGQTWDAIDDSHKLQITKLELQAGLPSGTIEELVRMKPKANLLATKDGYDAAGNAIVSFVYADENGNPGVVKTIKTGGKRDDGGGSGGGAGTFDRIKLDAAAAFDADQKKNADGKVSPELYGEMRAKVPATYRDDFDRAFADRLSDETKRRFAIPVKASVDDALDKYLNAEG